MESFWNWLKHLERGVLLKAALAVGAVFLLVLYALFPSEEELLFSDAAPEQGALEEETREEPADIKVDLKGEVVYPGVYQAEEGQRVEQVIQEAGGLTEEADITRVNLAQRVFDEMVVNIPGAAEAESMESTETIPEDTAQKLNINTAEQKDWETLPGIGPAKAEAIVQYREEAGSFQQVDDLINVPGIGEKTLETLRDHLAPY